MATNLEGVAVEVCKQLSASFERALGAGAHKQAFLIDQRGVKRALKIAPVSGELKTRFERESTALLDCCHPAIAVLHYVASHLESGCEYWVTVEEYLSAGTLAQRMAQGGLSATEIRHIGIALANALAHLHDRGLVHRDIKPANILFRSEREPVLTDFGIVRMLGEPSLTHDFMAQGPGTPLYAAPEQLLNEKASIDWRTDQFGLALVMTECILGRHPFVPDGGSQREAVMSVANRVPLSDQTKALLIGARFGCLIKALAPWPVQRYRWPAEFVKALSEEV
ncbi:MAG: serine/threonine protein kinase [Betaproteobacteria bacterium HGW-Betaproteobacteria-14]|nr:MAG: serine/threonine protein kinase [Betaproteobacteria bacterium HGW-Betaproteobacteria-14]